jgi:uridine kinase
MGAFVIGIGGGSASGKSTIARKLKDRLAPLRAEVMNQDRFFWERDRLPRAANRAGTREWPDYNQPDSFDWTNLRLALQAARSGCAEVVILEGILTLWDGELRELMDLKLFVEADADERIVRRIRRNVGAGYDLDGICDYYLDSVRYRHEEFCQRTKAHADLVIPGGRDEVQEAERSLAEVGRRVQSAVSRRRS